ncbi:MAG: tetratricopeptide repeat protein [Desulfobacteraceae bacterium]|nr:tetratricopeptide repeat protein [Desulfobacteraceae bacterium]
MDYFKIENIKNESGASAAIQNLQLDKYGQIIELLADFSLILPDVKENKQIVEQEINHQIAIYDIDEKPFALFMKRIMDKYIVTVDKKIREKTDMDMVEAMKICPQCAEKVLPKAKICKHCGYSFEISAMSNSHKNIAYEHLEKGKQFYTSGEYHKALEEFSIAIELKPDNGNAYYVRSLVHSKVGNHQEAENDLKEAASLGHKKAQEMLNAKQA